MAADKVVVVVVGKAVAAVVGKAVAVVGNAGNCVEMVVGQGQVVWKGVQGEK